MTNPPATTETDEEITDRAIRLGVDPAAMLNGIRRAETQAHNAYSSHTPGEL